MLLHHCTWADVDAYLAKSKGIIVPVGSTEQHGPNGIIGTDAICAEALARGVGQRAGALVAPVLAVGMAQHHMAFSGTLTHTPATLISVVREVVESLAHHGFRDFFFINGHGGNVSTLNAAFQQVYAEHSLDGGANGPALRLELHNWWANERIRALSKELFGASEGIHATPSEVSLTQHLLPETARTANFSGPAPAWSRYTDANDYRRRYPDGRIASDPSLASPEAGARVYEAAVTALTEAYNVFVSDTESSPEATTTRPPVSATGTASSD